MLNSKRSDNTTANLGFEAKLGLAADKLWKSNHSTEFMGFTLGPTFENSTRLLSLSS